MTAVVSEKREITVYEFAELSEDAPHGVIGATSPRERARYTVDSWLQESANEGLQDLFATELADWGFPTDTVEWSLGYVQGDGVAFYGFVDLAVYARKTRNARRWRAFLAAEPAAEISRNSFGHHYSHSRTMSVAVFYDGAQTARRDTLAGRVDECLAEDVYRVSRYLEHEGYAALEFSDMDIQETCDANEYRFNADGSLA